jgi:hypothetical protein
MFYIPSLIQVASLLLANQSQWAALHLLHSCILFVCGFDASASIGAVVDIKRIFMKLTNNIRSTISRGREREDVV